MGADVEKKSTGRLARNEKAYKKSVVLANNEQKRLVVCVRNGQKIGHRKSG